jgi:hypothetical protein
VKNFWVIKKECKNIFEEKILETFGRYRNGHIFATLLEKGMR